MNNVMKISELIEKLEEIKKNKGDLPIGTDANVDIAYLESVNVNTHYFYDIGEHFIPKDEKIKEQEFVMLKFEF